MTPGERRAALSLASIIATRMLGIFMILPVFALYAEGLEGVTPLLVGMAIGVYGLTQALLQIPFGMLSDRYGRKRIITIGLVLFAVGSVVAALADSIWLVILGRAIQGGGAVSAAILALAADLTREEHRTKAMAIIGMSFGVAFAASMVLGPLLNEYIGVSGIFWFTALLALLAIGLLWWRVPTPVSSHVHRDAEVVPASAGSVLRDSQLLRLDAGILILHTILTASFVVLPLVLFGQLGIATRYHGLVYLLVMIAAVVVMVPFIIFAERKRRMKPIFAGAVAVVGLSQLGLALVDLSLAGFIILLWLFFTAFNLLEASLPSLIAKTAPADRKGTAMGVYSSAQFFGIFLGGVLGGWLHGAYGIQAVFAMSALLALFWFVLAATMRAPQYVRSMVVHVGELDAARAQQLASRLSALEGVSEVVVIAGEGEAFLKVDNRRLDQAALSACLEQV
jgi:predicted MFS family arabinose efflux permease